MPWGYLGAKEWGEPGGIPILGCHGLLDNAGTFDRLAPLLPSKYHFVCYELPGYGLSSPLPGGFYPSISSFAADAWRVMKYLGWSKCSFIGHSLGGAVGLYLGAVYPERIDHLIGIDPAKPISGMSSDAPELYHGRVELMMAIENSKKEPRLYTIEEAIQKTIEGSRNSLTEETARIMLRRSVKVVDDNKKLVTFHQDKKNGILPMPELCGEQTEAFARSVGANTDMLIMSVNNGNIPDWAIDLDYYSLGKFLDVCDEYKRLTRIQLEGTHHVHLNSPEKVLPYIVEFLETSKIEQALQASKSTSK